MWSPSPEIITSTKSVLSVAASLAASAVLLHSTANNLIPDGVYDCFQKLLNRLSPQLTVVVEEFDGLAANQMFESANTYLGSKLTPSAQKIKVYKPLKEDHLTVSMDKNQEFYDSYEGVTFKWVLISTHNDHPVSNTKRRGDHSAIDRSEIRQFLLSFHKRHRDMVLTSYLPYILQKAKAIREEKKTVKLHTIDYGGTDYWSSISLNHPATFDSVAMEPVMKKELLDDLHLFTERKEYYRRVGKAWKRGYLLYGPPGTGKSSLIAAMANHLKFDIFDLDLREVMCNSDLRRLLIGTGSRSILVIEDIDCSIELQNRETDNEDTKEDEKVTLSGLLNFMDGLWTSCGDERVVICTTNYKDRLDPALLRPGRMDVHIHMSYCSFSGFKTLAANYLRIEEHAVFDEIEELLQKVEATPAEVAGELMKSADADKALKGLVNFLHRKLPENLQ
ncbi:AAA-ATPase At3g50940-like [Neltuma alba]|uniref:AAA-ATPase At3g50940-like n=1 Tax=Neltuma alba TaxID=207710 RepID=UPI0010A33782|nr:AAA-ATPase At3g50940-like [Prosopis alba]